MRDVFSSGGVGGREGARARVEVKQGSVEVVQQNSLFKVLSPLVHPRCEPRASSQRGSVEKEEEEERAA